MALVSGRTKRTNEKLNAGLAHLAGDKTDFTKVSNGRLSFFLRQDFHVDWDAKFPVTPPGMPII